MEAKLWNDMFVLGLPLAEKMVRPVIIYGFLVVGLRLAGKRQLAQLNPFDLVVLMTLANTVQNAIIGDDTSVTGGIVGAGTLLLVNYAVVRFLYGHQKLDHLIEGRPDVLIENGHVLKGRLKKELISLEELKAAAHRQGFASFEEVERAVLEPGGTISFFAKQPPPEEARHQELVRRLDELSRRLAGFRPGPLEPAS
jgi:uncharacterized membrane protein YcaP (DUF421 family)